MYVYPKKHKSEVKNEPAMVSLAFAKTATENKKIYKLELGLNKSESLGPEPT